MEILHKAATTTLAWREIKGIPKQGYNPVWTPPCIIFNWEIPQIIKKYSKLVWKNWLQHFSESLCKDNAVQVLKDLEKKTCQTRNISCLTFWSKWLLIIQENFLTFFGWLFMETKLMFAKRLAEVICLSSSYATSKIFEGKEIWNIKDWNKQEWNCTPFDERMLMIEK